RARPRDERECRVSEQTTAASSHNVDSGGLGRRLFSGAAGRNIGLVIALLILVGVGWITAGGNFMNPDNFLVILRLASVIGVVAIGVTFVITAGGIDLSVGSVLGLASVIASIAWLQDAATGFWPLMVVAAIAVGIVAGLV